MRFLTFILILVLSSNVFAQKHWGSGDGLTLTSPAHNESVSTTTITFKWKYVEEGYDINYEMLIGEIKGRIYLSDESINPFSTEHTKSGFLRGKTYQWRIICKKGNQILTWVDGKFTISEKSEVKGNNPCSHCGGSGKIWIPESERICPCCNGTGKIKWRTGFYHTCEPPIGACGGSGKIKVPAHWKSCQYCDGTGKLN